MHRGSSFALVYLVVLWVVAACDTHSVELPIDFVPTAERDYAVDAESEDTLEWEIPVDFEEMVAFLAQDASKVIPVDSSLYLARFGAKAHLAFIRFGTDTTEWHIYSFTDSLKAVNAFYNWLDCFGLSCQSIMVGQDTKIKDRTGQVWVTGSFIAASYLLSGKQSPSPLFWSPLMEDQVPVYHLSWKKNGRLTWWLAEENMDKP
jgi:hypothetical protein